MSVCTNVYEITQQPCKMCHIKSNALIHVLLLPDKRFRPPRDYHSDIYRKIRLKTKMLRNQDSLCKGCKKELLVVHLFRKRCLESQEIMEKITGKAGERHQVLVEDKLIDVDLISPKEGASFVIPTNVESKTEPEGEIEDLMVEELLEEDVEAKPEEAPVPEEVLEEVVVENEPETPVQKHICPHCCAEYARASSLDMHLSRYHNVSRERRRLPRDQNAHDIYFGVDLTRTCEFCFAEFPDASQLDQHVSQEHSSEPRLYTCRVCQSKLKTKTSLRNHYTSLHTDVERKTQVFQCEQCPRMFKQRSTLVQHREVVHLGIRGRHACDVCDSTFNSKSDLTRHLHRHTKHKPHACTYEGCEWRFPTSYQLLNHVRQRHTLERPHACPECPRAFASSTNLRDHMQVHKKEARFPCDLCSSVFSRKRSLDGHMKVHSGTYTHFCNICHAKFRAADALKKHKRVHEGFRPFRCLFCLISFKDMGPLKRHLTMEHNKKGKASTFKEF